MKKILSATIFGLLACASLAANATAYSRYMNAGEVLRKGDTLQSFNGVYKLIMQDDGNLVMYYTSLEIPNVIRSMYYPRNFSTGTRNSGGYAAMQYDGNFVVYTTSNAWVWQAGTGGRATSPNYRIVLEDDGQLYLATADNIHSPTSYPYKTLVAHDNCSAGVSDNYYLIRASATSAFFFAANCGVTAAQEAYKRGGQLEGYYQFRP